MCRRRMSLTSVSQAISRGACVNGVRDCRVRRDSACSVVDLVAVLQEVLPDHAGVDPDGAVVAWRQPRRGLGAHQICLGLPGVGHHRGQVQQLGHAVIDPGFGDDHPAVGVAAKGRRARRPRRSLGGTRRRRRKDRRVSHRLRRSLGAERRRWRFRDRRAARSFCSTTTLRLERRRHGQRSMWA